MSNLKNNIKAKLMDVSKKNSFLRRVFRSLLLTKKKIGYSKYKRKYRKIRKVNNRISYKN